MDEEKEYQTVILAALLHDIGKLLQRGSFGNLDIKGKHPQVSVDFISAFSHLFSHAADINLLKILVQHHHENPSFPQSLRLDGISDPYIRSLATLVSLADNFSASERGQRSEQWQDFKFTPLASVMHRLHLPSKSSGDAAEAINLHFRARSLKSTSDDFFNNIFPEIFQKYDEKELNELLKDFGQAFHSWADKIATKDFNIIFSHLMHFLYKYAWCVPSNTQESIPDISLYDHLKTTAAIAACLYKYHKNKNNLNNKDIKNFQDKRFCLLAGDLSGIQKYIFDISNIGAGGVARRLRSRSLFIQLITEACSHKILKYFDLPATNILMSAGGNFHLLLPNVPDIHKDLHIINKDIDRWFIEKLNGEITLNLAYISLDSEGFKASSEQQEGFGGVIRQVNDKLAIAKQRRFSAVLEENKKWREEGFLIELDYRGQDACRTCGKFPRMENQEECSQCSKDSQVGGKLAKEKFQFLAFFSDTNKGEIALPSGSVSLIDKPSEKEDYELLIKLNDTDFLFQANLPAQSKFIANYIPVVSNENEGKDLIELGKKLNIKYENIPGMGEPITFEFLAEKAIGRKYLGFLKMDADNMGEAMIFGLKRENPEWGLDTISRLDTLSRQIEWFFSGWMQHLISQKFKNCYTVFSGGDDLFIVGPWNEILDLADEIRTDYAEYTGNPELTLSAGIITANASYPVSQAADEAESAVKKSKNEGRHRVTLLGYTLTWEEWRKVKEKWEELRTELKADKISSAFLYSLLEYGRMWKQYKEDGLVSGLRFQPLLAYNINRNLSTRQSPTFYHWAQSIASLRLDEMQQKQVILDNLGLLAQLLILGKGGEQ